MPAGQVFRNHPHYWDQPRYNADQTTAAIQEELAHTLLAQDRSWWRRYSRAYWQQPKYFDPSGLISPAIQDELSHPLPGQPPQNRATRAGDIEFKQKPLRFEDDSLLSPAIGQELSHKTLGQPPTIRTNRIPWLQPVYRIDQSQPELSVELNHVTQGQPPQRRVSPAVYLQPVYRIDQSTSAAPDLQVELNHITAGQPPQKRTSLAPWLQPRYFDLNGLGLLGTELQLELTQEPPSMPQQRRRVLGFYLQPVYRADQSSGNTPPDLELELTHTLNGQPQWRIKRMPPLAQTFPWLPDLEAELSFPRWQQPQRRPVTAYWHQPGQPNPLTLPDLELELTHTLLGQRMSWQQRKSLAYWLQRIVRADQSDHTVVIVLGGHAVAVVSLANDASVSTTVAGATATVALARDASATVTAAGAAATAALAGDASVTVNPPPP